jgi:hypothetical protein
MTSTYASYQLLAQDMPRSLLRIASRADVARDTQYYRDNIGKVTSLDQFLNDRRLFSVALKAHGMEDMINAKAFMRKVLESDLSDPKSFANRLADTRYAEFARAFNFSTSGGVRGSLAYAQNEIQVDDISELYSEHRLKQGVAAATEVDYYQAKIATLTSVDELIADERLFAFALVAAGLDPSIASEQFIRSVLTSDLSDANSVANRVTDERYRILAAAFSFEADGSVAAGSTAQTAAQLDETVYSYYTLSGNGGTPAAAALNTSHYADAIGSVTSVDGLIDNDRLFTYALIAYGINPNTASKTMIRQVLTSDLSDPQSYANSIEDIRFRALAAAFNFATDGSIGGSDGAQSAEQLEATQSRYLEAFDAETAGADASATSFYRGHIYAITNVDELLNNSALYTFTLEAFGFDPATASKSKIRQALTSDLANPSSFARTQADPRYRELAEAFNFGTDGQALQPRKAQTDSEELATIDRYASRGGSTASAAAAAKAEGIYYHNTITRVRSLDDFLADKRLVAYVLKAYGLDEGVATSTLRKVLTSDPMDKNSFVNKQGSDQRFRDLAAAFNFATDGSIKRVPEQAAQSQSGVLATTDGYVRQTMEADAGEDNEGVRLALYFRRKAGGIDSAFDILADKALLKVVQTALGIPSAMSQADIDLQAAVINKRLDLADLKEPKKVEKFLARFAAMYDIGNGVPAASSPALAVLGGTTSFATDVSLLSSLQRIRR